MLNFDKLFKLAKDNGISIYTMYTRLKLSRSQIYRIKEGRIQAATLDRVLQLLYEETGNTYQLSDICTFIPDPIDRNEENEKKKTNS